MRRTHGSRVGRFLLRLVGAGILGCLLAVAAAFFLVQHYASPERLQALIVAQLQQTFRRPVSIRRVSVVLQQGVRVDGLRVGEGEEVLLSSEALLIRYKLSGLLRGRLELDSVHLSSPRIDLVRGEDGRWEFLELLRRPSVPHGLFSLPPLQSADEVRIEDGELLVRDLLRRRSFRAQGLRLAMDGISLRAPFPVEGDFRAENAFPGRRVRAEVSFNGVVSLGEGRFADAYAAARRLEIRVAGRAFSLSGTLRDFTAPRLDLRAAVPALEGSWLAENFSAPAALALPAGTLRLRLAVPASDLPLSARPLVLEALEADFGFGVLRARGRSEGGGKGKASVSSSGVDLARLSACWEPWSRKGLRGRVSGSAAFSGTLSTPTLSALALDLRAVGVRISSGQRVDGLEASLKGARELRDLELSVRGGSYTGLGNVFSDLRLDARIRGGDLEIRSLESSWKEARAKASGCVLRLNNPREVVFDAVIDRLRTDELYAGIQRSIQFHHAVTGSRPSDGPWARVFKYAIPRRFPDLRGRIRVTNALSPNFSTQNLELLLDLKDIGRGLRHVGGRFRVGFGPGRVSNVQEVRAAHIVLNVLLLPFTYMHEMNAKAVMSLDTATPRTFDFNRVYGDFSVRDGDVDVHLLHVDGPQFVAYADGQADFARERIEAKVLMRLTKSRGQLPDRLVDAAGRPSIELQLSGDLNKPAADITLRKMGRSDIEDALATGMRRIAPLDPLSEGLCGSGGKP